MAASSGTRRFLSLLMSVLGLAGVGALIILTFGRVTLREFSPLTFKRRSFTYFQIPWIHQQITPTVRSDDSTAVDRYLHNSNLIQTKPSPGARWDIISVGEKSGSAEILISYLDNLDGASSVQDWSKDHPEMAKCLWSAVQEAAELQAYELLPELFEMSKSSTDPQQFCTQINQWLATAFDELAADYRKNSDEERAAALEKAAHQRRQPQAEISSPAEVVGEDTEKLKSDSDTNGQTKTEIETNAAPQP